MNDVFFQDQHRIFQLRTADSMKAKACIMGGDSRMTTSEEIKDPVGWHQHREVEHILSRYKTPCEAEPLNIWQRYIESLRKVQEEAREGLACLVLVQPFI